MGLYGRYVVPRLIDFAMKDKRALERRAALIPHAEGNVVEIGIGSGLNLPFYGSAVKHLYGVDPSATLLAMAHRKSGQVAFPMDLVRQSAEELPFDDASIDTAVSTWTLCSIADPRKALREMKRVLKPQGRLLFVEHGHSPDSAVHAWQRRFNPVWRRIAGGCNLDRRIDELIESAGFDIASLQTGYLRGPRPFTYTYEGSARR